MGHTVRKLCGTILVMIPRKMDILGFMHHWAAFEGNNDTIGIFLLMEPWWCWMKSQRITFMQSYSLRTMKANTRSCSDSWPSVTNLVISCSGNTVLTVGLGLGTNNTWFGLEKNHTVYWNVWFCGHRDMTGIFSNSHQSWLKQETNGVLTWTTDSPHQFM